MLGSAQLLAFIGTVDLARSRSFYEGVLGLRRVGGHPGVDLYDSAGTTLRISEVASMTPLPFTVLGWLVPDIETVVRGLRVAGVEFERYPWFDQDELGIWMAGNGDRVAWFRDPDGNTLSITQAGP